MTDPINKTEPMPTVPVTIIEAAGPSPSLAGTIATTPGQQPNLIVNVVTPLAAIGVRFVYDFSRALLGALTAAGLGVATTAASVGLTTTFKAAVIVAALSAGYGLLQNVVTIFSGLEKRFPLASGSV